MQTHDQQISPIGEAHANQCRHTLAGSGLYQREIPANFTTITIPFNSIQQPFEIKEDVFMYMCLKVVKLFKKIPQCVLLCSTNILVNSQISNLLPMGRLQFPVKHNIHCLCSCREKRMIKIGKEKIIIKVSLIDRTVWFTRLVQLLSGKTVMLHYHSFSGPNVPVCLAWLQMELCRAANIFTAR